MNKEESNQIKCANCRFWDRHPYDVSFGSCRIFRPMVHDSGNTSWPETHDEDWCGEFQSKETSNEQ